MMMNAEGFDRKWPLHNLRYYAGICLKRLRKTTKNLNQHSRSPRPNLNLGIPEYVATTMNDIAC
jgi:hypothetical protein